MLLKTDVLFDHSPEKYYVRGKVSNSLIAQEKISSKDKRSNECLEKGAAA